MAIGETSAVQVRYVEEAVEGTTPSGPLKNFRATSATIKQVNNTVVSNEIRTDAQVTDLIRVGVQATASIGFELSFGALDDFLGGALRSDWVANTGLSGAQSGTDLLANGTTHKSFTLEANYTNIGQFISIVGAKVNSLSITARVGQVVTGTIEFIGRVAAIAQASVGVGAASSAPTGDVFSAVSLNGINLDETDVELLAIELQINNNARPQQILGTTALAGVGFGRFNVTGTIEAYFADAALMSKYFNFAAGTLDWQFTDAAGNDLLFRIDRYKPTDGEAAVPGNDQDVIQRYPFQAMMSTTSPNKTLRITRTPA